ncbi:MAG: [FeFe] hydrogenase H-cluster radical SAM maturase HydE [Clostridiales bacterium]|nr:[FeFe] hydrogenase H-cluster radical SAM maturase HydE [Clostridiales bacterium]
MSTKYTELIDKIATENNATKNELIEIITNHENDNYLFDKADELRQKIYGKDVFLRGLIEFTNYCKNNCLYCGIRMGNHNVERYRLTKSEILECCETGYKLGFRTFVLQGGEDLFYTDEMLCDIIKTIKSDYNDCAITLSLGERSFDSFQKLYDAGADRYLLRHETSNPEHYTKLHPQNMSLKTRTDCLLELRRIGFQVGAGFMVGSPYQTTENLAEDLLFLKDFNPHMVGIGPFIPHKDTPYKEYKQGSMRDTLVMVALTRLLIPKTLLPSTTALGTINPQGREMGLKAGANVVMPNLSPTRFRELYSLYDNKICTGDEAAECRVCLEKRVISAGFKIVTNRGDSKV